MGNITLGYDVKEATHWLASQNLADVVKQGSFGLGSLNLGSDVKEATLDVNLRMTPFKSI